MACTDNPAAVGSTDGEPVISPTIREQPRSVTVGVGAPATFSVAAEGSPPLSYQWMRDGAAIPSASASSYTIPAAALGDSGARFAVRVSNPRGAVASDTAVLSVLAPPSITTQPANVVVALGQPATFRVTATGSPPLGYQWRRNGTAVAGATSASFTSPPTVAADHGATFAVVVTNPVGSSTSTEATLTVVDPPRITGQTGDVTVKSGEPVTMSVAATGVDLAYHWYRNGAVVAGATSASYSIAATARSDSATEYTAQVSNIAGTVSSAPMRLTVTGGFANGLAGFRAELPAGTPPLTGIRFHLQVIENRGGNIIIFGSNRYFTPGAPLTYLSETTLFSTGRINVANNTCAGWPPAGTLTPGHASLWAGLPDYPFAGGSTTGLATGILNDDAAGWPIQQSGIDNIPDLYRTDAMSSLDLEGKDVAVTITRGATVSDVSAFGRCGRPLVPQTYREWVVQVNVEGHVMNQRAVLPDQGGRFIVPTEAFMFYSEFLAQPNPLTVHYWAMEYRVDGDSGWSPVRAIRTGTYDGLGTDFGVRPVTVSGVPKLEFSNRRNVYLLGGGRVYTVF